MNFVYYNCNNLKEYNTKNIVPIMVLNKNKKNTTISMVRSKRYLIMFTC